MITRHAVTQEVSLTASLATTEAIRFSDFAGGVIYLPAGITSLTWYASHDGTTYVQLNDKTNTGAADPSSVTAERAYPFPDEAYGAMFLKIVANNTGTANVSLKT